MSIRSNIEEIMIQIREGNTELGDRIQAEAIAAIKGGQASEAWTTYMNNYSKTARQLERLIPTDDTEGVEEMDTARTYLVGNGPCGAITTGFRLLEGVEDTLDNGLEE